MTASHAQPLTSAPSSCTHSGYIAENMFVNRRYFNLLLREQESFAACFISFFSKDIFISFWKRVVSKENGFWRDFSLENFANSKVSLKSIPRDWLHLEIKMLKIKIFSLQRSKSCQKVILFSFLIVAVCRAILHSDCFRDRIATWNTRNWSRVTITVIETGSFERSRTQDKLHVFSIEMKKRRAHLTLGYQYRI